MQRLHWTKNELTLHYEYIRYLLNQITYLRDQPFFRTINLVKNFTQKSIFLKRQDLIVKQQKYPSYRQQEKINFYKLLYNILMQKKFGKHRLEEFYHDPNYININHGSFGTCPKAIIKAKRQLEENIYSNLDRWYRIKLEKQITKVREFIADLVNCKLPNIFIVPNATEAYNTLVKSIDWEEGDVIALPNTAYRSVVSATQWLRDKYKIKIFVFNLIPEDFSSFEKLENKIIESVKNFDGKIKLAVIDHIISSSGMILPLKKITKGLHKLGVSVFVDGAHAMCHVPIDLQDLGVDAYFCNFHKWGCCPVNSAFLYVSNQYLDIVRPTCTGKYQTKDAAHEFFQTGTRDLTSYLMIPLGIKYLKSLDENQMRQYCHGLAMEAGKEMARMMNTQTFTQEEQCIGFMNSIRSPSDNYEECVEIQNEMLQQNQCFPKFFKLGGKVFFRISCHIYNQLSDYQFAAIKFLERLKKKRQKSD